MTKPETSAERANREKLEAEKIKAETGNGNQDDENGLAEREKATRDVIKILRDETSEEASGTTDKTEPKPRTTETEEQTNRDGDKKWWKEINWKELIGLITINLIVAIVSVATNNAIIGIPVILVIIGSYIVWRQAKEQKTSEIKLRYIIIMEMPTVIVVELLLSGIAITLFNWWGLTLIGMAGISFAYFLTKIPAEPPHVGLVKIWGKRIPVKKEEGWILTAPCFPFFYEIIQIKVEKINLDFVFADIRTRADPELIESLDSAKKIRKRQKSRRKGKEKEKPRAGGEVSANISLTYTPDYKSKNAGQRLISFLNSGGEEGVRDIIKDLIEEDVREMSRDHSWEEFTFSAGELTCRLITKLTGQKALLKDLQQDLQGLRKELQTNGLPDVADLGILLSRFTVGKVKEQGELATAAESFAKEVQERRGEEIELAFVIEQTKKLRNLGIDPGEALDGVQIERGKATKDVKSYRGLGLEKFAETLGKSLGDNIIETLLGGKKKEK